MFQENVDSAKFAGDYLNSLDNNSADLSGAEGQYQQNLLDARRRQIEDDISNGRYSAPEVPGVSDSPSNDGGTPDSPGTRAKSAARRLAAAKTPDNRGGIRGVNGTLPHRDTRPKTSTYRGRH